MMLIFQITEMPFAKVMLIFQFIPPVYTVWVCRVLRLESQMEVKSSTENVMMCSIITQTWTFGGFQPAKIIKCLASHNFSSQKQINVNKPAFAIYYGQLISLSSKLHS